MRSKQPRMFVAALCLLVLVPGPGRAGPGADLETVVARVVGPLMKRYDIPGMAVGVVAGGRGSVHHYGVMSRATGLPVADETLFEIGSLSKTFTATLAAYAQVKGRLSLSDAASKYLPALAGSSFDHVSLLNLGTHTSGGLPLQVPDAITNDDQLMAYFRTWTPTYAPGTTRTYANPSIGMLGMIAARSLSEDYEVLMERDVFRPLGMKHAFLHVPEDEARHYAQGYTKADLPIRMAPGVLASEAYGVRTTAGDMLRFVEANMGMIDLDPDLQRAILDTHIGYDQVGPMVQDLIWEQYRDPVTLADLLAGNADQMGLEAHPVVPLEPPSRPDDNVLIDKTGSTNGFAAFVIFAPGKKIGLVLLANRNYPIAARVTAAYEILTQLEDGAPRN